jgi:hypothetical protein
LAKALALGHAKLPDDGFPSPMGFWFAAPESWGTVVPPLRIEFFNPEEQDSHSLSSKRHSPDAGPTCSSYQARLRLTDKRTNSTGLSSLLIIDIDSYEARISVTPDAWTRVSEAVLLIVAQHWRFLVIDELLDEITAWVHRDLRECGFVNLIRRRRSRKLRAHRCTLQGLILDLPDFELLLTNPRASLPPGCPIRLYRALATQLGLKQQRRAIDERVEVVEAVLDALVDSLNHLQSLALQIVLELAIVTLLLIDVGLYLWGFLAR